ncbi:hypothetical protein RSAG8_04061, partial [Rhizoctonia solani AG-8 WAC10335]
MFFVGCRPPLDDHTILVLRQDALARRIRGWVVFCLTLISTIETQISCAFPSDNSYPAFDNEPISSNFLSTQWLLPGSKARLR